MCCEFGPPDISLLGPPPKPPGLNFDLVCEGSNVIVQPYDTSPFLSSGRGSSNGSSTVNIIAIVLFSVAAVILIVFSIVLWYKRKVLLGENKVKNDVFTEDTQYLDNYRAIGKIWKLPRAALLINRPGNKHHSNHNQNFNKRQSSPTENTPIYEDTSQMMSDASLRSPTPYTKGYHGEGLKATILGAQAHSDFQTSPDRASSTTSGISSDGDLASRVLPNVEMRHGHGSFRKPRKQRRRYSGHDSPNDYGCDHDQRALRSHSQHARTLPREPNCPPPSVSPQTLARFRSELCNDHMTARRDFTTPRKDYITPRMLEVRPIHSPMTSPRPLPQISVPGDNGGISYSPNDRQLFEMRYENQYANGNPYGEYSHVPVGIYEEIPYSGNRVLEPLPAMSSISDNGRSKKKQKRRGRKGGDENQTEYSEEKRHNMENELRESYA